MNPDLQAVWDSRATVETDAGPASVISLASLLQMKVAAGRPQDIGDIQRLTELDR